MNDWLDNLKTFFNATPTSTPSPVQPSDQDDSSDDDSDDSQDTPAPAPEKPLTPPSVSPVTLVPPQPAHDLDAAKAAYEALLKLREGCRYRVYEDSLGKPTGGIGHLILPEDHLKVGDTIPSETVDAWFAHDGQSAWDHAVAQAKEAGITDVNFLPYLASVCFQLGNAWTSKFPNTWRTIVRGDYVTAAVALQGTAWAKQTPSRVKDFQDALRRLPKKPA